MYYQHEIKMDHSSFLMTFFPLVIIDQNNSPSILQQHLFSSFTT